MLVVLRQIQTHKHESVFGVFYTGHNNCVKSDLLIDMPNPLSAPGYSQRILDWKIQTRNFNLIDMVV